MKRQTVTLKIRKTHLFLAAFLVIAAVTAIMLVNAYGEYKESLPQELDDTENIELIQLSASSDGALSATISTDMGDMTAVLYDEYAPNAVRIFTETAKSGGYDGLVIGLYEQGSVFTLDAPDIGEEYTEELHKNLWPFKGALCMTENGDIIFINTVDFSEEDREYLLAEGELSEVRRAFAEYGGVPDYSRKYTVFGQVCEGTDILEQIARSPSGTEIKVSGVRIDTEQVGE